MANSLIEFKFKIQICMMLIAYVIQSSMEYYCDTDKTIVGYQLAKCLISKSWLATGTRFRTQTLKDNVKNAGSLGI